MPYVFFCNEHYSKKRGPVLHVLRGQGRTELTNEPLIFVTDAISGCRFLVDTGSSISLIPRSYTPRQNHFSLPTSTVMSLQARELQIFGIYHAKLDLGFSRLYSFDFHVFDWDYGILGSDFLHKFNFNIDMSSHILSEAIEVTRCSRESDTSSIISEMSNSELSDPDVQHCIFEEEFLEIFEQELRSKDIKHTITATVETASEVPIASKVRRLSAEKFRALQDKIKRLTSQGILVPSHSPWSFPIVMVKKKTPGAFRLCADFTALNKILKAHKYPLPNVLDFASLASGSKFFSSLDCSDAYYNIPVAEEHQHKLCITTPLGSFQYRRLPMGLASSASWYQLLMNQVLKNISNCIC